MLQPDMADFSPARYFARFATSLWDAPPRRPMIRFKNSPRSIPDLKINTLFTTVMARSISTLKFTLSSEIEYPQYETLYRKYGLKAQGQEFAYRVHPVQIWQTLIFLLICMCFQSCAQRSEFV